MQIQNPSPDTEKNTKIVFLEKNGLLYIVNMRDSLTKKSLVTEDIFTFAKAYKKVFTQRQ